MADSHLLVVGRLRKPHGLKGEVAVFPLTDDAASVFTPGRRLARLDLSGVEVGDPVVIERSRTFHREWLLKFRGVDHRDSLESFRDILLAVPADELKPPEADEVYLHELTGFSVRLEDDSALGLVTNLYEVASGLMLEVQGPKREFLLPYKKEFVRQVDRAGRRLVVALPDGLMDL
ncbi:MAG: ribosome maturation factor RimM [Gemmatimonadota bacterium]